MDKISLQKGVRFALARIEERSACVETRLVKYKVGIALKEMGFNSPTDAYVYKCYPYDTISARSFKNSYSKVRVAIPTVRDAVTFFYNRMRICIKINRKTDGTQSTFRYSIGTVIPVALDKIDYFHILEHKDTSYSIEDEVNDALLKMYELFKKCKKIKSE